MTGGTQGGEGEGEWDGGGRKGGEAEEGKVDLQGIVPLARREVMDLATRDQSLAVCCDRTEGDEAEAGRFEKWEAKGEGATSPPAVAAREVVGPAKVGQRGCHRLPLGPWGGVLEEEDEDREEREEDGEEREGEAPPFLNEGMGSPAPMAEARGLMGEGELVETERLAEPAAATRRHALANP
jgi:hypothetical protein